MGVVIVNVSDSKFSLNGIEYEKNFQSLVFGDLLTIKGVYDSSVILQDKSNFSEYTVNGSSYGSAALLQSALIGILFVRGSEISHYQPVQALYGLASNCDCSISVNSRTTLTGDTVITLSNLTDGMSGNIKVLQDATGGHTLTILPTPKVINGGTGAIALTGDANSTDILSWWYDGADLNVTYGLNYN